MKTTSQKEQNRKYVDLIATIVFCICICICAFAFAFVFPQYITASCIIAVIVIVPMAITCYLDNKN